MSVLLAFFLAASVHAQAASFNDWEKVDGEVGLSIFEKKEGDLLAFRTEGVVDAPLRDVAGAILDYEHTTEWVDHLEEERILSRPSPGQFVEYTHVGTPFVLKDRDFVCLVTVKVNEKEKTVSIESHSVDDPQAPSTKFVRGRVVHNEFVLAPDGTGKTRLTGEFHIDPKGSVPKWIVNHFQRAWPKKAFHAIQARVASVKPQVPAALEGVLAPIAKF